jgi:hypothetical protein
MMMSIFTVRQELEALLSKVEGEAQNAFQLALSWIDHESGVIEAAVKKLESHGFTVISPVVTPAVATPVEAPATTV